MNVPLTKLETKYQNMSWRTRTDILLSMDVATEKEDAKIDEIIAYNEKGQGFAPYRAERAMIKRMVRKGLVIDTISGVYAIAYLCNLR